MKQPEDTKTKELALEVKRGRGRPAKANALTPAQRAQRYRDKARNHGVTARMVSIATAQTPTEFKKQAAINLAATQKNETNSCELPSYGMLEAIIIKLRSENKTLKSELEIAIMHISAETRKRIEAEAEVQFLTTKKPRAKKTSQK